MSKRQLSHFGEIDSIGGRSNDGQGRNAMKWPNGMEPGSVAVYARNEIEIAAAPERVWRWLIGGERWPQWYGNCSSFRYTDKQGGPDLAVGRSFEWRTFGTGVSSV